MEDTNMMRLVDHRRLPWDMVRRYFNHVETSEVFKENKRLAKLVEGEYDHDLFQNSLYTADLLQLASEGKSVDLGLALSDLRIITQTLHNVEKRYRRLTEKHYGEFKENPDYLTMSYREVLLVELVDRLDEHITYAVEEADTGGECNVPTQVDNILRRSAETYFDMNKEPDADPDFSEDYSDEDVSQLWKEFREYIENCIGKEMVVDDKQFSSGGGCEHYVILTQTGQILIAHAEGSPDSITYECSWDLWSSIDAYIDSPNYQWTDGEKGFGFEFARPFYNMRHSVGELEKIEWVYIQRQHILNGCKHLEGKEGQPWFYATNADLLSVASQTIAQCSLKEE